MTTTFLSVTNRASASLASDVDNSTTTWVLVSGGGLEFPSTYPFHITCGDEIVSCTNKSTDTLTVVRAQQDTIASSHPAGAPVELHITAKSISDLNSAVNALESAGGGDMTKAVYDPDADGDIAETQLQLNYPTHSNATDHAQNTDTDLDATFEATFEKVANKGAVSGYCGLDGSGLVDGDDLPALSTTKKGGAPATGTPSGKFLKDDNTWAAPAGGGGGMTTLRTTSNQTINAGAGVFTDITGLTFPVTNGVDYAFYFYITFQSAATATGWKAGVNCPTGALDFWAKSDVIANGAAGVATHTERHNVVRDDMTLLTATITQAVDLSIEIRGRYCCTQDGTFAARFANELASNTNIVVQKGSWGYYF